MVFEKAPILIYSGLRCNIQDGISHVNYTGITLFHIFFDRLCLYDIFCWGLAEHESTRWVVTPLLVGESHHNTAWGVFDIYQRVLVSSTRGIVGVFFLFHLLECFQIILKLGMSGELTVPRVEDFISTVASCNIIKVSLWDLLFFFSVSLVVPNFPALQKHELVADPVWLRIYVRVIIMLIIY